MDAIAAAVLAAGGASRFGQVKQLLPIGNRPVLAYVLEAVRAAPVDVRLVVLGHAAAEIQSQVNLDGILIVLNHAYTSGQSSSVQAAIRALPDQSAAVVFVLGDQPEIQAAVIERLVTAYRSNGGPIVQPVYRQGPGNPILIDRCLYGELAALRGDVGARPLLARHRDRVQRIELAEFDRPEDIDTPEDYQRVKTRMEARSPEP